MRKIKINKKSNKWVNIVMMLISFVMIAFVYICTVHKFGFSYFGLVLMFFAFIIDLLYFIKKNLFDIIFDFIIKFRYLIAFVVFIICVLFKIHGSSIGVFDIEIPTKEDETISYKIFGEARPIRSDEFLIMTPYNLSQKYNNYDIKSNIISLDGQNMIIGFNSAVRDITVLGKPLVWGYLLLGNEYGISWYWCLKTILFILLSYELVFILTKNKKLSLVGSLLITYGPSMQWWFTPHMPDVILWFTALFVMVYYLFNSERKWFKNALTIMIPFTALEYVVALFPSFQVSFGYFFVVLFLAVMFRDKNKFYSKKENIIRISIIGVLSCVLIGYFLLNNMDAIKALSNTIYPGSREDFGGVFEIKSLFTDLGTPFLGYIDGSLYTNQCEDSTFIHFGIFYLMLTPLAINILKKNKDRDYAIGISFVMIILIYGSFMIFGFPKLLARLTLFKYINRMNIILGYILVLFTVWGINAIEKLGDKVDKKYYYLSIFAFLIMCLMLVNNYLKLFVPVKYCYFEIILFGIILFCLYKKRFNKMGYSLLLGLLFFSSITINPVISGISPITNHPSTTFIHNKIKEDNDAYWIGYNNFRLPSYLISIGAKTANAIDFYPDLKKWDIIDPNHQLEHVWNRYSYIITQFVDGENRADCNIQPDVINLFINNKTVYDLGVKYVLTVSSEDLTKYNTKEYKYNEIYQDNAVKVYELEKL